LTIAFVFEETTCLLLSRGLSFYMGLLLCLFTLENHHAPLVECLSLVLDEAQVIEFS
jgi:hypothetical protein